MSEPLVTPLVRCKRWPSCTNSAADAAHRGPYAGLCEACLEDQAQVLRRNASQARGTKPVKRYAANTLDSALAALQSASHRLERAAALAAEARQEKHAAVVEFNGAIREVNAQAQRVLNAPRMNGARVDERMERERSA